MHEMTLAIQAVKTVIEFAEDNDIKVIDTVVLEIGELSMVIPEYMEDAWKIIVPSTMLKGSKLRIDVSPGNGLCQDCGAVFNIIENKGVCPKCGSQDKEVLCGTQFNVKEILVPDE